MGRNISTPAFWRHQNNIESRMIRTVVHTTRQVDRQIAQRTARDTVQTARDRHLQLAAMRALGV
jgi:hypothetical protein